MFFLENEIDGSVLLKLSESMVVRLFPTIKLEVQFLDLLQTLKQRHAMELNSKKTYPPLTNGRTHLPVQAVPPSNHVIASSSYENGNGHSSNSNSPTNINGHHSSKLIFSERAQIQKGSQLPLKALKREPKYFLNQYV